MTKQQNKRRAHAFGGLNLDVALVEQHDLLAEAEPDAAAVFAGAEKGDEDLVEQFGWHAEAVIGYLEDGFVIALNFAGEGDARVLPVFYGFDGVYHEVDHYLFNKVMVGLDREGGVAEDDLELDVLFFEGGPHQAVEVLEHVTYEYFAQVEPGDLVEAAVAFGEFKQALAAAFDGVDAQLQVFEVAAYRAVFDLGALQPVFHGICKGRYRCYRVHDLVRHYAQQLLPGL